jgi:hypothetical protein
MREEVNTETTSWGAKSSEKLRVRVDGSVCTNNTTEIINTITFSSLGSI